MAAEIILQRRTRSQRPLCVNVVHVVYRLPPVHHPLPGRAGRLSAAVRPAGRRRMDSCRRIFVRLD